MRVDHQEHGTSQLPIERCLPELLNTLENQTKAVLVAEPGAGKTSRIPLAMLDADWLDGGKIIVLEPRRLAARSAAFHMAKLIGEQPGQTIGYRVRMESKTSKQTRIEFVTEGVFTRMIIDDPTLVNIGAVIFDEFHERSLDSDLGLALALDAAGVFRPDLRVIVMSATLDSTRIANLLSKEGEHPAPIIKCAGRSFPVTISYRPRKPDVYLEDAMASAIMLELQTNDGNLLCFLPGRAEIERVFSRLEHLPADVAVHRLFGSLEPAEQTKAISLPPNGMRKVILATSIAETSITIEGVNCVIDSGLSRVPVYDPAAGLTRLATVKASKSAVKQRAGRAGRTAAGSAIRLWHEGQTTAFQDFDTPEVLQADLSSLVLDLARWGVKDPYQLLWLDQPPRPAWEEAHNDLKRLGAISADGTITETGRRICDMNLPPRLACMVLRASQFGSQQAAARMAVLLEERGLGGNDPDLSVRLERFSSGKTLRERNSHKLAERIGRAVRDANDAATETLSSGVMVSFAWPERIAERLGSSPDGTTTYRMAGGRQARLENTSNLARAPYLAIGELQGRAASYRILNAAEISQQEIRLFHDRKIERYRDVRFDPGLNRFQVREEERLGSAVLNRANVAATGDDDLAGALIKYLAKQDPDSFFRARPVAGFIARARLMNSIHDDYAPSFDKDILMAELEDWLLPFVQNATGPGDITQEIILSGLEYRFGQEKLRELDRVLPRKFELPSGTSHQLHYTDCEVILRARVQEFFGMNIHPALCNGKLPLTLEFLSPAMRPIQKTKDVCGFWGGSWLDVKKEMKGRYPKHFWPDDPSSAPATTRTKPRQDKN